MDELFADAVAMATCISPQEWDWWLTRMADCVHLENRDCGTCHYAKECLGNCLMCDAFDHYCDVCMMVWGENAPIGEIPYPPCRYIPRRELIDRAIEKLEILGVF